MSGNTDSPRILRMSRIPSGTAVVAKNQWRAFLVRPRHQPSPILPTSHTHVDTQCIFSERLMPAVCCNCFYGGKSWPPPPPTITRSECNRFLYALLGPHQRYGLILGDTADSEVYCILSHSALSWLCQASNCTFAFGRSLCTCGFRPNTSLIQQAD